MDTISSQQDGSNTILIVKSIGKTKKYWVNTNDYLVLNYIQYDDKNEVYLTVDFSMFEKVRSSAYAKKIIIQRPAKGERLTLFLTEVNLNQSNLSFYVEIPDDYRRIRW
jgi:hypothetical protein